MIISKSQALFSRASAVSPGGVNSPVRAFKAVGGTPIFMARGDGAWVIDVDGNRYLDCIGSWGPLLFGHSHPRIRAALESQLQFGTTFGAPTRGEVDLAEAICAAVPSVEMVRLVSSGTEAVMSAVRCARGVTGRNTVVKFEGCYHGHADHLLAKSGSGLATLGVPDSAGVPEDFTRHTLTIPYNDTPAAQLLFKEHGPQIACVIVEPAAGNMGCVPPDPGFLQALRELTSASGALLVFDEVMTGFRLARGGAQELFGIMPDITTLGKIVGGGMPLAAYGGRKDVMRAIAPLGPVYQAGTLSGNPMAVSAGLATLALIEEDPHLYERLAKLGHAAKAALERAAGDASVPVVVQQLGSMITVFFTPYRVVNYQNARGCSLTQFRAFFNAMLQRGVYWPPSQFEAAFISAVMTDDDIEKLEAAACDAMLAAALAERPN